MRSAAALLALLLVLGGPLAGQERARETSTPGAFFQALGDSTLERLIGMALESNRDLRAVEARVRETRATRTEAALDLAPAISLSAGYSRQRLASATFPGAGGSLPDQDLWDAGLRMSWEVDVWGRLRRSVQGRSAVVASAEEDVRDVRVLLASEVASAYFDLRGAHDRLAVARQNADNQRRTLALTEDRLELGRGNALDTERAQAQLSSTLATIPALEAEVAATEHRIGVLLGRSPGSVALEIPGDACPLELPADLPLGSLDALVARRPDVQSAERMLAARTAFADAAQADYLPRISIDGVAGYTSSALDALGETGTPRYAIGPVISWPFLDLGRVKSRVDAARAGELQAEERYQQTVLTALEEAETSLASYRKARERLEHLEEAAAASDRATELARLRFEEGVTDFLEVLDAERRQLETQDRLAAGRTEATGWLIAVYRSVGGTLSLPPR
jgi:NodT family efflux transporter outer membrane factor (OMF) lipoprotein